MGFLRCRFHLFGFCYHLDRLTAVYMYTPFKAVMLNVGVVLSDSLSTVNMLKGYDKA